MTHSTTGYTPFFLLFGRQPILPLEFSLSTFQTQIPEEEQQEAWLKQRVSTLANQLDKAQDQAQRRITSAQEVYKSWYDKTNKTQDTPQFQIGDQVLKRRLDLATTSTNKLQPKLEGPYYIHELGPSSTYKLRAPSGRILNKLIHGNHLKTYLPSIKPQPFIAIP
jgi:hypothetical protein